MHFELTPSRVISFMIVALAFALLSPTLDSFSDVKNVSGYGAGISVDNTSVLNGFAIPDDTYTNGFRFRMRVTIDSPSENLLGVKFDDWSRDGGGGTIPVASNMLVNLSATTAGALSAGNAYGSNLSVVGDADNIAPGVQKDVYIWLKVPGSTVGGSYSTNY
jgi:hypothetical protein